MNACCWPEQEAVWKWMEAHGIELDPQAEMDLKDAVTEYRLTIQRELEQLRSQVSALQAENEGLLHMASVGEFVTHQCIAVIDLSGNRVPSTAEGIRLAIDSLSGGDA